MRFITLEKENIVFKEKVKPFLNPDLVYIPLLDNKIKNKTLKKGEMVFNNFYSAVSGTVIGTSKIKLDSDKYIQGLVIRNDFCETPVTNIATRRKINNLSYENVINSLTDIDLKNKIKNIKYKTIIINGIDDDPYIKNEAFIQKIHFREILNTIDLLQNLYPESNVMIVLKSTDNENILNYTNFLGSYKNITLRLVEDYYLLGKEQFIKEYLQIKEDTLHLKTSEVYNFYQEVKRCKPTLEKYITISGDGVEYNQVYLVKLGTKINSFGDFTNFDVYLNGIMGKKIDPKDLIVTKNLEGIVVMQKKPLKSLECIKCGQCLNICPIHSNPLLAYKKQKKIKCIDCGLCSYICPSFIPLEKYIRRDSK